MKCEMQNAKCKMQIYIKSSMSIFEQEEEEDEEEDEDDCEETL